MASIDEINNAVSHYGYRTMLWNGVGTATTGQTAADAIKSAGLDWEVELRKAAFQNKKGNWVVDTATQKIVRVGDDGEDIPFATVGGRYVPIQNAELFDFGDTLVDDFGANWESGWSEREGRIVGLTMKFPETITVGGEDAYNKYLLFRSQHDGKGSVRVIVCMTRISCTNMVLNLLRNASLSFSIPHITGASQKIAAAREALEISLTVEDEFHAQMERLLNTELRPREQVALAGTAMSDAVWSETAAEKHAAGVLHTLAVSPTIADEHRNTQYGLYNAATEYLQWLSPGKTAESTLRQNITGWRANAAQALLVA